MELRQLRHFREIARASSFGKAAEVLNLTQPALSKSMANLERSLGCKLLERHPTGIALTRHGVAFLSYADLVTSELERAVDEMAHLSGHGRGLVRVGSGATLMHHVLPEATRRFTATSPAGEPQTINFRQGMHSELVAMLRRGDIDLMVGPIEPSEADTDLRHERVLVDRIGVMADRSNPLARQAVVTLSDIAASTWVVPERPEPQEEQLIEMLKRHSYPPPRIALRTGSANFMAALVKDTGHLSYLPVAITTAIDGEYGHLVVLPLAEPIWDPVEVGVTYRRRGVMLPPARRFINRLKDVGRDLTAAAE
jgi:LysR family transcriptional regulator of gallate degradation